MIERDSKLEKEIALIEEIKNSPMDAARMFLKLRSKRELSPHEEHCLLEKAAANGSSEAQLLLGLAYEFGVEVEKDYEKAIGYYKMAAGDRPEYEAVDAKVMLRLLEHEKDSASPSIAANLLRGLRFYRDGVCAMHYISQNSKVKLHRYEEEPLMGEACFRMSAIEGLPEGQYRYATILFQTPSHSFTDSWEGKARSRVPEALWWLRIAQFYNVPQARKDLASKSKFYSEHGEYPQRPIFDGKMPDGTNEEKLVKQWESPYLKRNNELIFGIVSTLLALLLVYLLKA